MIGRLFRESKRYGRLSVAVRQFPAVRGVIALLSLLCLGALAPDSATAQPCPVCPQVCHQTFNYGCTPSQRCAVAAVNTCTFVPTGCSSSTVDGGDGCCYTPGTGASPILLDLDGQGFHLTDVAHGVFFKVFPGIDKLYQVSWPAQGSHDAWLVLDRNGNGMIDDFGEMFGNWTPQPTPPPGQERNGFLALAEYDKPENGGDGDGWITDNDLVFRQLRVWQDSNHNGISEPSELRTLTSAGIKAISLRFEVSRRTDQYGNQFRYRSQIRSTRDSDAGKVAYDVFLVLQDGPLQ